MSMTMLCPWQNRFSYDFSLLKSLCVFNTQGILNWTGRLKGKKKVNDDNSKYPVLALYGFHWTQNGKHIQLKIFVTMNLNLAVECVLSMQYDSNRSNWIVSLLMGMMITGEMRGKWEACKLFSWVRLKFWNRTEQIYLHNFWNFCWKFQTP